MSHESQSWTKAVFRVGGVVACVAALLLACGSKEHELSGRPWEQQIVSFKNRLTTRYDAIEFPPKDFTERKVFTYNLQELLTRQPGKSVLFDGFLDDITKDGKGFAVHFTSRLSQDDADDRSVAFHLRCEYDDVKALIENPPEYRRVSKYLFQKGIQKDFLVVCVVTDVEKIVNYSVMGRKREGSEDVELDVKSPDTFSAHGRLLEMAKYSDIVADRQDGNPR
jgi:hypothetical protein